ncbi:hypothetical protein SAMN02949497_1216 [Methylomagnum ishizawai]|uniref:Uncharacterized protein n=1 Tax=Methylomagnum ishizawai TaxID=1760988 RepID=A0A1Y6CUN8_9GAMM|nr:hypothetical protein [Methylomagnum ishizawai]SMF93920.1 hypothetical protein SAMN02949497_1216 [Methylomagnum ishizawai]
MPTYAIRVDLSALIEAIPCVIDESVLPRLALAVRKFAEQAELDWKEDVLRAHGVWIDHKKQYAASIQTRQLGPFSYEVFSDLKLAEAIETGRPAYDLKRMLDSSLKVRRTKDGRRYLIIPFRHNTPGNDALARPMPQDIYKIVGKKGFGKSLITGVGWRNSGTGALSTQTRRGHNQTKGEAVRVATRKYVWGDRLPAGLAGKLKPHHATDIYAGMVRMNTSSGKQKSSKYLTFRVMREGVPKWIIPARPGLNIAQGVADRLRPLAEEAFREAVVRSVEEA